MKNSEFDKFIRKQTQQELDVPEELSWDQMNISIPKPKKKRRGIFGIWFALFGLIILIGGLALSLDSKIEKTNSNLSELRGNGKKYDTVGDKLGNENGELGLDIEGVEGGGENVEDTENTEGTEERENTDNTENAQDTKDTENVEEREEKREDIEEEDMTGKREEAVEVKGLDLKLNFDSNVKSQDFEESFSDKDDITAISLKTENVPLTIQTKERESYEKLAVQNIEVLELSLLEIEKEFRDLNLSNILQESSGFKGSIFVNLGFNQARNSYIQGMQSEVLTEAEDVAIGNSFQVGLKFPLRKNLFVFSGLTYQKLHTTFKYSEFLDTEIDLSLAQRTTRIKHIFHNNYMEYLQLNLGLSQEFYFGGNWGGQLMLSLNPTYQLRATGRTLNDDLTVFNMKNHLTVDRLLWNVSTGVGVYYQVKNNRIVVGVDWQTNLSDVQLLENSDLNFRSKILTLKLGVERKF